MRLLEEPYKTPPGFRDFPFAYIYDATGLTNTSNYLDIQLQFQGDADFILRHIAGVNNCVATAANSGRWNLKGPNRQYANGSTSSGIVAYPNWPVVPEKWFGQHEGIWFDLFNVLRAANTCGGTPIPTSYIGFFGIKRFREFGQQNATTYRYRELPYRYEYTLTIDWAAFATGTTPASPRRFNQPVDNFDFELMRISISSTTGAAALTTQDFAITLYDPQGHALSNLPIPQTYINSAKPSASTQPTYQPCFPVPTVVYPAGSAIVFDIQSLLCGTSLPQSYNISFEGVWRLPC